MFFRQTQEKEDSNLNKMFLKTNYQQCNQLLGRENTRGGMTQSKVTISAEVSRAGGHSLLHCLVLLVMCRQRYCISYCNLIQKKIIILYLFESLSQLGLIIVTY